MTRSRAPRTPLLIGFGVAAALSTAAIVVAYANGPGLPALPGLAALDADRDGAITAREIGRELLPGAAAGAAAQGRGGRGGFGADPNASRPAPQDLAFEHGTATIPDRETFKRLAYQGDEVRIDTHLKGLEFVKFVAADVGSGDPAIYFMNTKTHRAHMMFLNAVGLPRNRGRGVGGGPQSMMGVLVYRPFLASPSGQRGLYTFEFEPNDSYPFEMVTVAHALLEQHSPILKGNLAYHPMPYAVPRYEQEKAKYEAAGLAVFLDEDVYTDISFLPLNVAEGYGRLRLVSADERPGARDVVLYRTLPNEMPRVAGVITAARQTPLSHVNLRAVQDKVPNAYIRSAADDAAITGLAGKYVYYRVAPDGYELREATTAEIDRHYAALRPSEPKTPARDLSVKTIRALSAVSFADASSVGVKAANVATLRTLGFQEGVVPDGFAIPFAFYDEFMRVNGFHEKAAALRDDARFRDDADSREAALAAFRKEIEGGRVPDWMTDALGALQRSFPGGTSIRLRSSTNNEDLPGFSGAGLYDSFTHREDEGHLSTSVKEVYASLWNFRAYEEREFYRIDHAATAMGILVHPNYSDERANGVAVTDDIVYQTGQQIAGRSFYVNVQLGEDLVTNPGEHSIPEEILLSPSSAANDRVVQRSNLVPDGAPLLTAQHLDELRQYLNTIEMAFRQRYGKTPRDRFAMEIEFKITAGGRLAIKQARPWVY